MSWVFLAGPRVYKLKKPVRYPFLDFSTLAAREHFVREEVRLNRRLSADVYLDATPLSLTATDTLTLGAGDEVVDWLVTMRRLPDERMLDRLIADDALTDTLIDHLADVLADFFAAAPSEHPEPATILERYDREHAITTEVLLDPALGFDGEKIGDVLDRFAKECRAVRPLLEARIEEGRIIDGHGDLRPEHICLTKPIAIIDCLEFNPNLRLLDPFEEITFLGLECARLGADQVFPVLYARCRDRLNDNPPVELIRFYWRYRALLRARLSLAHLFEPEPRTPEKWRPLAWRYVALAEQDLCRLIPPDE